MAKKQIRTEIITDDLDGTELPEGKPTIQFAVDGVSYEIDLSEKNEGTLRKALTPFIEAATVVRGGKSGTRKPKAEGSDPARLAAIRAWAAENGIAVAAAGRISKATQDAYDAAQSK